VTHIDDEVFSMPEDSHDAAAMRDLLRKYVGITDDEHGRDTPLRFLSMLDEMTSCRDADDEHMLHCLKWKDFDAESQDMISLERISFVSVCNHHLAPFLGTAHIAYVPDKKMAGLSKFARAVRHFAQQAQVQERLTAQIGNYLEARLEPKGVGVILKAEHQCMSIRGVRAENVVTTTSTMRGVFADHAKTAKAEFLQMIGK
jgi:GTP cyclohydrolase I